MSPVAAGVIAPAAILSQWLLHHPDRASGSDLDRVGGWRREHRGDGLGVLAVAVAVVAGAIAAVEAVHQLDHVQHVWP